MVVKYNTHYVGFVYCFIPEFGLEDVRKQSSAIISFHSCSALDLVFLLAFFLREIFEDGM